MNNIWQVKEVSTYPYKYKVYPTRKYAEKNDACYYFISEKGAKDFARILNQDEDATNSDLP